MFRYTSDAETALTGCDGILLAITCYTFIGSTEGDQMVKKGNTNKAQLKKHYWQVYKALVDLTDLHVWPANRDIAELEGELLE